VKALYQQPCGQDLRQDQHISGKDRRRMITQNTVRDVLQQHVALDPYLMKIGESYPSHGFLSRATQGVYCRLVNLLKVYAQAQYGSIDQLRVLDWGAGKGHISYLMKQAGFNVTSCDIVADAIDSSFGQETPVIKENAINIVPLTDPWKLPFDDGEFDIVLSFGVLEHVPNDAESMKEIRRVLRRGGTFFFCFLPYHLSWTQKIAHMRGDFYHAKLYRKADIAQFAQQSDFTVGSMWHGQIMPKNSTAYNETLEKLDRMLTFNTPLKYFATNIEGFMVAGRD